MLQMVNSMTKDVVDCRNVWLVNLGTSNYVTSHGEWFSDVKSLDKLDYVETCDDIQWHMLVKCHLLCKMAK